MCEIGYFDLQRTRVENLYSKRKHSAFGNAADLANWYITQLVQFQCKCFYCETSIHDINHLIDAGLLKERKIGYGYRGRVLEINKNDNTYICENCVLSCYYCNNDKSYTLNKEDYKKYFGNNRKLYFDSLINQL